MGQITHTLFYLLINVLLYVAKASQDESLLVQTKSGPVQGITTSTYSGKNITSFYGIPYSQPPVGNLRFKPPRFVSPWTDVFHADKKPRPCHQHLHQDLENALVKVHLMVERPWSEDCLRLNIWVPQPAPTKAAVIVHIHGGGFIFGSSLHFFAEGHTVAQEENVVFVSINYRLSVFGFIKLADPEITGNVGLMDQQMALRWIHDNIESFGGDPSKITVAGFSAGGASVGFHLLSPGSRGLFQRGILTSGTPVNPWAFREPEDLVKTSLSLVEMVNCTNAKVSEVIQCMQAVDAEVFDEIGKKHLISDPRHLFGPIVDGVFITEHPEVSLEARRFNNADVLIGVTSDEGVYFLEAPLKGLSGDESSLTLDAFEQALKRVFNGINDIQIEAIKNFYVDWSSTEDPHMLRDRFANLLGDALFVCGTNRFADRFFGTGNQIFRYVFDQKVPSPHSPNWGGAGHGADGAFLSGLATATPGPGAELSRTMMKMLGNFARTG